VATVNKAALRSAFDTLKARFESLCADGKMGPEGRDLIEALVKHEAAVLRFARDPDVPFTNNRAERDIRMAKGSSD